MGTQSVTTHSGVAAEGVGVDWLSLWAVGGEESIVLAPVHTPVLSSPSALSLIAETTHTQDFDFAYQLRLAPVFLNLFKFA